MEKLLNRVDRKISRKAEKNWLAISPELSEIRE